MKFTKLIKKIIFSETFLYLIVGGLTTIISWVVFIFVNEFSEKAKYYNTPTIKFIQQEMNGIKEKEKFSIIDDCKEFMIRISEEIM